MAKKILLVEDDTILAITTKTQLNKEGYDVEVAISGEEAVDVASRDFDLVLMDINLGKGIDGTQAAELILKNIDIPIVFLSSHTEKHIVEKTEQITSYGYVVKNTGIVVLDASIKMAFKLFEARAQQKNFLSILEESQEVSGVGSYQVDFTIGLWTASKTLYKIFGIDDFYEKNIENWTQIIYPEDREDTLLYLQQEVLIKQQKFDKVYRIQRVSDKKILYVHGLGEVTVVGGKTVSMVGTIQDITDFKLAQDRIKQDEIRQEKIIDILQHKSDSIQEFLDYCLNQCISMTNSKYGYIYRYSEENQMFELNTWSKDVMDSCRVAAPKTCYELNKTSFWGEAVRQRKPVFSNNFQMPHPLKKGLPEGHVAIKKFLTCPIFRGDDIVGVVGLANKEEDYNDLDIIQINIIMEAVWKVMDGKKAEEALKKEKDLVNKLLGEKEILLIESNHRIKNNLASIEGLIMISLNTVTNEEAKRILLDSLTRISGVKTLYDHLLVQNEFEMVSSEKYITSLVEKITKLFNVNESISISLNIKDFKLSSKQMFSIGIVINELITNIAKYAFSDKNGNINLFCMLEEGKVIIEAIDDGRGLPEDFDINKTTGFGIALIKMIVRQFDGTFDMVSHGGTKSTIKLNVL